MTVGELKAILEDLEDDVEVVMQYQPNYPLKSEIAGATLKSEVEGEKPEFDEVDVLYLVEGEQIGYGNKAAWNF